MKRSWRDTTSSTTPRESNWVCPHCMDDMHRLCKVVMFSEGALQWAELSQVYCSCYCMDDPE
jgi:hypothetical protein